MTTPNPQHAQEQVRLAEEAYRQAVTEQYYNGCPDLHEVFFRPLTEAEWQSLGYTTGPIVGMDLGGPDPAETAVLAWPHQHGKAAHTVSIDIEVPLTDGLRSLFDALAAAHSRELGRRLRRLADDLGQWEPHVRVDFQRVQQVLEDHGIGDGYGRLTIPQPVRPPIEPPAIRW
ncbi:hypothetical protein [Streptomyces sp. PAM3C]|uniref:hypothetical protein n=1 Tax=Streptomyces sp. PAM3C TaxID=2847300 RepID=UPI001C1E8BD8|nr:hypothetical protein [Streptomyces sp. PAM3C]MBU5946769.1 hypothetical protein [Streptomyces sp. PAM3C]